MLRNYERYLDGEARETPADLWLLAYPQGYWDSILSYSRKYGQDPYFIAAIIREESQFRAEALSPAGARGVMQVMPATGEWIAQNIRMPGFDRTRLFEYDTAINLGTWYISHLMKKFRNDAAPGGRCVQCRTRRGERLAAARTVAAATATSSWNPYRTQRPGDMSRKCSATTPSTAGSTASQRRARRWYGISRSPERSGRWSPMKRSGAADLTDSSAAE